MSLDINSLSKNPSLDSRTIYLVEIGCIYLAAIALLILAMLQGLKIFERQRPAQPVNVQQTQIENAIKALTVTSN